MGGMAMEALRAHIQAFSSLAPSALKDYEARLRQLVGIIRSASAAAKAVSRANRVAQGGHPSVGHSNPGPTLLASERICDPAQC